MFSSLNSLAGAVVEAAGDDDLLVDDHQLVMHLAQVSEDAVTAGDVELDVGMGQPPRGSPFLPCLPGVQDPLDSHPATG